MRVWVNHGNPFVTQIVATEGHTEDIPEGLYELTPVEPEVEAP